VPEIHDHPNLEPRPMRRLCAALTSLVLILNPCTAPAWAWGRTGHRVIAKLAERHLTERARAEIRALLEPGESLAVASTWADEVRGRMWHTAPWHYVDVPLDEPRYDDRFAGDTPDQGYIVRV
jgi:S1/P1 Nuclease